MAKHFNDLIWDYLVFILIIIFTTIAPLWSNIRGKKEKKVLSKSDYVFATGSVSVFAMMLSVARGTLGVRVLLGYPSELYYRGAEMWETLYGFISAYPIVCFVFIPVYFNLGITSAYQYLDMRFKSRLVRLLASFCFIVRQCMNLGVTVYTPTVALNTVIGIPYWASLLGITVISIIFNILGGLKHAIKADVIQSFTMLGVTAIIIVQGFYKGGGIESTIKANKDSGRLEFFKFSGDPTVRVDTFTAMLGQLFISLSQFGCQQNFIQRYLSLRSLKEVNQMMMSNIPMITLFFSLPWIAGLGVYATYALCDPLKAGFTKKRDEILPFFVEDQFDYMKGFIGLFMATLFNGALSIHVSNLNSLATVTWEDFLCHMKPFKKLKDKQQLHVIKFIGTIFGILTMGIGFSVGLLPGVIESSMLMTSVTSGPLLGAFLLAILFPIANWKGTAVGMIVGKMITTWLVWGNLTLGKTKRTLLETSIDGCSNDTFASDISKPIYNSWLFMNKPLEIAAYNYSTPAPEPQINETLQYIFSISYMYYSFLGTFLTVAIGLLISAMTQSKEDSFDSKLIHPMIYRFTQYLPGKKRVYADLVKTDINNVKTITNIQLQTNASNKPVDHVNLGFQIDESETDKKASIKNGTIINIADIVTHESLKNNEPNNNEITRKIQVPSETYRKIEMD